MSWDAYLLYFGGRLEWNYTHNTNAMIAAALEAVGHEVERVDGPPCWQDAVGPAWWRLLDGRSGVDGWVMLRDLVATLEKDPEHYRQMNPPNGWGSYDRLLEVLREMRDASAVERPATWEVDG